MLQRVLSEEGFEVLAIPYGSLSAFLLLASLVDALAALWPARRAARLDCERSPQPAHRQRFQVEVD